MKKIISLLICMVIFVTPAFAIKGEVVDPGDLPMDMNDSLPSDWAGKEIAAAQHEGIIPSLTGNPQFTATITREQFAELVVCMVEKAQGTALTVSDELFTDSSNQAVLKAYAAGIVSGVGNNKFDPTAQTNREQIFTMMARATSYLETKNGKDITPLEPDISKFSDKGQVSSWAVEGMGLLAANGISKGTSDTTLSPKASCTVEQAIILIYRLYSAIK